MLSTDQSVWRVEVISFNVPESTTHAAKDIRFSVTQGPLLKVSISFTILSLDFGTIRVSSARAL